MESAPTLLERNVFLHRRGDHWSPAISTKPNIRRGGVPLPPVRNFIQSTGCALLSLPCVRGGAARSAAEGLYLTQRYSFHYIINFHTRFSLQEGGAKKSYQKKRQKETRKGGFLKKSPFKSPKNFWATHAGMLCDYL